MDWIEAIAVGAIVAGAVGFLAWQGWRRTRGRGSACPGCGSSCPAARSCEALSREDAAAGTEAPDPDDGKLAQGSGGRDGRTD